MAIKFPLITDTLTRTTGAFLDPTQNLTVMLWANPLTALTAGQYRTFWQTEDGGFGVYFGLYQDDTGALNFDAFNGSDNAIAGPVLSIKEWVHVALVYVASTHVWTAYCNGVSVGTMTLNISAGVFTKEDLGTDGGFSQPDAAVAYFRSWQAALSPSEILADAASGVPVKTANLFTDTPLPTFSAVGDYSGNSHDWTAVGSPQTYDAPFAVAPTPVSPRTIPFLPTDDPIDVSGLSPGINYWKTSAVTTNSAFNVGWWTYTPPAGVFFIYIAAGPTLGADPSWTPSTTVWVEAATGLLVPLVIAPVVDPQSFWGQNFGTLGGGWFRVPVTAGTPIWINVNQSGGHSALASGALVTMQIQNSPQTLAPVGALVISDDTDGYPAAIINGATGDFYQFRAIPAGEFTAILPTGELCTQNGESDDGVAFLDSDWTVVATWTAPNGWGVQGIKTDLNGKFYVALSQLNLATPPTRVYIFLPDGTLLSQHNLPSDFDKTRVYAVSRDGVKWFAARQGEAGNIIHVYNLSTDLQLSDLSISTADNFSSPRSGYVADDGSLLFAKTRVERYDPSTGALLQTYTPLVITRINEFAYTNTAAEAIAIWGYTGFSDNDARFEIFLIDGTHVSTSPAVQVSGGSFENQGGPDPDSISNSCPIWFTSLALSPPTVTGSLTVVKVTDPPADPTSFPFTATGGLSPSTFNLVDGGSEVFSGLDAGTYGVSETAPTGWSVGYAVSNGSPHDAITVAEGEDVTVTVTNTQMPGTIIVRKVTAPATADTFTFVASGGLSPGTFSLGDGDEETFTDVAPGSGYGIAEDAAMGYTTTYEVSNDSPHDNITVAPGETVTVTVTNTSTTIGAIIVVKRIQPPSDDTFDFVVGGGLSPTSLTLGNEDSHTFSDVAPGTYSIVETVPVGWAVVYTISNGSTPTRLTVAAGETVTVLVTNQESIPPDARGGRRWALYRFDSTGRGQQKS